MNIQDVSGAVLEKAEESAEQTLDDVRDVLNDAAEEKADTAKEDNNIIKE